MAKKSRMGRNLNALLGGATRQRASEEESQTAAVTEKSSAEAPTASTSGDNVSSHASSTADITPVSTDSPDASPNLAGTSGTAAPEHAHLLVLVQIHPPKLKVHRRVLMPVPLAISIGKACTRHKFSVTR